MNKEEIDQLEEKVKYWVDIHTELKKWLEEEITEQENIWKQREIIFCYKNVLEKIEELENSKNE